jgi:SSS family solute:Na+ symporter
MNMHFVDWGIIVVIIMAMIFIAEYTRRYTSTVADFLSANRCAGRYMLTLASSMASLGAITVVAMWEQYYEAGFAAFHWVQLAAPVSLFLAISGWIVYRFRETRALTMAQFLEMRYSRRFRVFAGILCWVAGVLNYGIFPAVTGRFFIYFLGLKIHYWKVFGLELNLTLGAVMAFLLGLALIIALAGGQIAILVTDFIQGQFVNVVLLILLGVLLYIFPWNTIIETLSNSAIAGQSKLNPFRQENIPDFNPLFFLGYAFIGFYTYRVWQGNQGYNSSAINAHESKMACILSQLRDFVSILLIPIAAICAYVLLHAPEYAKMAASSNAIIASIPSEQIAKQMTTTVVLSQILPAGLMGLMAAVMLMAAVSTDNTYLHSWGSIFVQDVLMPLRQLKGKGAYEPDQHMKILRWAIAGVAVFAWLFSMLFPLGQYIIMYFQITGAIFTGGAGAVIIGGFYWRRGTVNGAWAAMITGSFLSVFGVVSNNILWPKVLPFLKDAYPKISWLQSLPVKFWLNGMQLGIFASFSAILVYVIVSLLDKDPEIDMDKLLHRGKYDMKTDVGVEHIAPPTTGLKALWFTSEFSFGDKIIYCLNMGWMLFFMAAFIVMTVLNTFEIWSDKAWSSWWYFFVWISGIASLIITVWFIIGGCIDLRKMFKRLRSIHRNASDDGTVSEHLGNKAEDLAE